MKRMTRLGDLVDRASEPYASFHDATLSRIMINYDTKTLSAEFEMDVGNPDEPEEGNRNRTRQGVLNLSGLILWTIEPPQNDRQSEWDPPWIVHDCLIGESSTEYGKRLSAMLGPDVYAWCMFFSDMNAFGYCICAEAEFQWKSAHNQAL